MTKDCDACGNPMTLLLNDYVCDWCDGLVEEEWAADQDTLPLGNFGLIYSGKQPGGGDFYMLPPGQTLDDISIDWSDLLDDLDGPGDDPF